MLGHLDWTISGGVEGGTKVVIPVGKNKRKRGGSRIETDFGMKMKYDPADEEL